MSESVSASASVSAPSATASSTSAPQGGTSAPSQSRSNFSAPSQSAQSTPQGAPQEGTTPTARELGEQDFDALVTVKVNGQEKKVPIKEAIKNYQLEQAAQERMRQAAEERKRIQGEWQKRQQLEAELKKDPVKLLKHFGLDPDQWSENYLAQKYERMQMDPHQREALEYKEKLAQYEAQENASKQDLLSQIKDVIGNLPEGAEAATKEQLHAYLQHQKQVYQAEQQRFNQEIAQAWKDLGLPAYSSVGKDIAFQMLKAQKQGRSLQASEAAAIVKEERLTSAREIMTQMDAKAIQEFLGPELMKKLRDYDVERVTQGKGPQFNTQNGPGQPPASPQPKKYLNQMEWRKHMGIG